MELSPDVQPLSLPLAHVIIDNKLKSDRQGKPVIVEYRPATNASVMKVLSDGEVLLQLPLSQERYVELLTQTNPMV